ncbi:DedA family protein [Arcobacter sp. FWKO B]|uniref:DedA family protein n=1 Tax=Arcobacter sp. FWKO B TaxID=2593672 RepID=UPI0018A36E82|nr:DedA family protein [Arcobacter sp. FWKO B]QOG12502.1 DedA family protein [Arcobacter sp. FWKO B]
MGEIIAWIVKTVGDLGYIGIFVMMFLESSFFPFPSEVVMIPAGYLAYKGEMNLALAIACGIGGSLAGALFNYYLAIRFGRAFLAKYGKYVLIKEQTLEKMEDFFAKHGHISTFSGRLIPAVRQYISLPAGLARMDLLKFSIYTSLGAGIWVAILALLGYYIGHNEVMLKEYLQTIIVSILVLLVVGAIFYIRLQIKKGIITKRTK